MSLDTATTGVQLTDSGECKGHKIVPCFTRSHQFTV